MAPAEPIRDDVLDPDMLAMLAEVGVLHDAWDLLESTTPVRLDALASAAAAADRKQVHDLAHALKGASLQAGARALGELCRDLERDGDVLSDFEISRRVAALHGAWDAARAAFRAFGG